MFADAMHRSIFVIVGLVSIFSTIDLALSDRTHDKVYVDIKARSQCFRRLNGTHQVGCSTSRKGVVGVLHYVNKTDVIEWMMNTGPHAPYVALMTPTMFTKGNVDLLRQSGTINGVIVIHHDNWADPDSFSPDQACPNEGYGMYPEGCDMHWHDGRGMAFEDYDIPIMIITKKEEIDYLIKSCFEQFNEPVNGVPREYPLCSAQVKDAMDAAKDTPTCMRRSDMRNSLTPTGTYCDPLANHNVHFMSRITNSTEERADESVVMVMSRMDSFSMFDKIYPGADSPVTSIVTLLAVIEALGKPDIKEQMRSADKDVLFSMFHGEAYDYIGSSRVVYDMDKKRFPFSTSDSYVTYSPVQRKHIDVMIEVSQVGIPDDGNTLYMHVAYSNTKAGDLARDLQNAGDLANLKLEEVPSIQQLPPASLQSFYKGTERSDMIAGIVIADHKTQYMNTFYNSRFDTAMNINLTYPAEMNETDAKYNYESPAAKHLTKLASTVAKTVYHRVTGEDMDNVEANVTVVANMLYCLLETPQCDLYKTILSEANVKLLSKRPYPFYVSVINDAASEWIPRLIERMAAYYGGDVVSNVTEQKECDKMNNDEHTYHYLSMSGTNDTGFMCMKALSFSTEALSPAFMVKEYDWESKQYSSWSESVWQPEHILIRVFLVPSIARELQIFFFGLFLAIAGFVGVYFIQKRSHLLFTVSHQFQPVT